MNEEFSNGFTYRSYLNLCKEMTEGIYKNQITAFQNSNCDGITKGLVFNFINNGDINACAEVDENNYDNIKVNTGTIGSIYSWFFTAFSSNLVYPEIAKDESKSNYNFKHSFDYAQKQIRLEGVLPGKTRISLANTLALFAIRYICAHELGHLLNGHSHYTKTSYGIRKIHMIESLNVIETEKNLASYPLDRRALEMDADGYAATSSMMNLNGLLKDDKGQILHLLENPLKIFELWAFAVHCVFMLFEKSTPTNYSKAAFYLPNAARQVLNLSAAKNTLISILNKGELNTPKKNIIEIGRYFEIGITKAETFFNLKNRTSFNFIRSVKGSLDYKIYADEVLQHWDNVLLADIKKFARADLYDPNMPQFMLSLEK